MTTSFHHMLSFQPSSCLRKSLLPLVWSHYTWAHPSGLDAPCQSSRWTLPASLTQLHSNLLLDSSRRSQGRHFCRWCLQFDWLGFLAEESQFCNLQHGLWLLSRRLTRRCFGRIPSITEPDRGSSAIEQIQASTLCSLVLFQRSLFGQPCSCIFYVVHNSVPATSGCRHDWQQRRHLSPVSIMLAPWIRSMVPRRSS